MLAPAMYALTVVLSAAFPLGQLPGQQCLHPSERPQVGQVESGDFVSRVKGHLRDPFLGARELGAGVTYHVPLTEVELFAEGRRVWRHQWDGGTAVRAQFDVVYAAGLSFRLPF